MKRSRFVALAALLHTSVVSGACDRTGGAERSTMRPRTEAPSERTVADTDAPAAIGSDAPVEIGSDAPVEIGSTAPTVPAPSASSFREEATDPATTANARERAAAPGSADVHVPGGSSTVEPEAAAGRRVSLRRVLELEPIGGSPPRPPRADGHPTDTAGLGRASDIVLRVRYEGSAAADTWHAWLVRGEREQYLFGGWGSLFDVASVVEVEHDGRRLYVATLWIPEQLRFHAALVDAASFELVGPPILVEPKFTIHFPRGPWVVATYPLVVLGESRRPMIALVAPNEPARLYPSFGRRARVLPHRAADTFARRGPGDEPLRAGESPFVPVARLRGSIHAPDAFLEPVTP